jgi:hypothetical protein
MTEREGVHIAVVTIIAKAQHRDEDYEQRFCAQTIVPGGDDRKT